MVFRGFPAGKTHLTSIPEPFFSEVLPKIEHFGELKVVLYVFWRFSRMEGTFRFLRREDFLADELFMQGMGDSPQKAEALLDESLERCIEQAILLDETVETERERQTIYFLNSPKGRAAVDALQKGKWHPFENLQPPVQLSVERMNIFRLYEENIGALTPMIVEQLRDAEQTYPMEWVEDAIRIAVTNNVRNWRYVEAILRRWQEKGRDGKREQEDSEQEYRKYVEGKYAEYIRH